MLSQIHTLHALRPVPLRSVLILSTCLRLNCYVICFLPAVLPSRIFQDLMNTAVRAKLPAPIIRCGVIARIIFGGE